MRGKNWEVDEMKERNWIKKLLIAYLYIAGSTDCHTRMEEGMRRWVQQALNSQRILFILEGKREWNQEKIIKKDAMWLGG